MKTKKEDKKLVVIRFVWARPYSIPSFVRNSSLGFGEEFLNCTNSGMICFF
jgi:hypothetical protein